MLPPIREPGMVGQVAANLQRPLGELATPLSYPEDFPVNEMLVNMGLGLREA